MALEAQPCHVHLSLQGSLAFQSQVDQEVLATLATLAHLFHLESLAVLVFHHGLAFLYLEGREGLEFQELQLILEVLAPLEVLVSPQVPGGLGNQSFLVCLSQEVQQDLGDQVNRGGLSVLAILEFQCLYLLWDLAGLAFLVVLSFLVLPFLRAVLAILCLLVFLFQVIHEVLVVLGGLECPSVQSLPLAPSRLLIQEAPLFLVFLAFRACLVCQFLGILVDLVFLWFLALRVLVYLELQVGLLVQSPQEDPALLSNWLVE